MATCPLSLHKGNNHNSITFPLPQSSMGGCASAQRDPEEELNNAAPAPEPAREEVGEENEGMKQSLQSLFNEMDKKEESSKKEKTEGKEEASKTKDDKEVQASELQKEEPEKKQHEEHVKDDIKENTTESKTQDQ